MKRIGRLVAVIAAASFVLGVGAGTTAQADESTTAVAPNESTTAVTPSEDQPAVGEQRAASGVVMANTQKMSSPHLSTVQYGTYYEGTRVTLSCAVYGQRVSGWGGSSSLWYWTGSSYVADVDLSTGSDNPITGKCSREVRAMGWGLGQVGSGSYYNLCERFVENAYGTSGRYATALTAYRSLKAAGQIRTSRTNIPAGALVFSDGPVDGPNGHVMLSIGAGRFVSGGANGPSVKIFTTPNPGSTYLGWAPAPSSWPGRG